MVKTAAPFVEVEESRGLAQYRQALGLSSLSCVAPETSYIAWLEALSTSLITKCCGQVTAKAMTSSMFVGGSEGGTVASDSLKVWTHQPRSCSQ